MKCAGYVLIVLACMLAHVSTASAQDLDEDAECRIIRCPRGMRHSSSQEALADGAGYHSELSTRIDVDGNGRQDIVAQVHAEDGRLADVTVLSFQDGWTAFVYAAIPISSDDLGELTPVFAGGRTFLPCQWSNMIRPGRHWSRLDIMTVDASGSILAFRTNGDAGDSYEVDRWTDDTLRVRQTHRPPVFLRWNPTLNRLEPTRDLVAQGSRAQRRSSFSELATHATPASSDVGQISHPFFDDCLAGTEFDQRRCQLSLSSRQRQASSTLWLGTFYARGLLRIGRYDFSRHRFEVTVGHIVTSAPWRRGASTLGALATAAPNGGRMPEGVIFHSFIPMASDEEAERWRHANGNLEQLRVRVLFRLAGQWSDVPPGQVFVWDARSRRRRRTSRQAQGMIMRVVGVQVINEISREVLSEMPSGNHRAGTTPGVDASGRPVDTQSMSPHNSNGDNRIDSAAEPSEDPDEDQEDDDASDAGSTEDPPRPPGNSADTRRGESQGSGRDGVLGHPGDDSNDGGARDAGTPE